MSEQDKDADATSADDTTTTDETTSTDDTETTDATGEDALGDAGKKALDAMKARVKAAEKDAREAKAALAKSAADAALKDKPADEQAIEKARAEAKAEARAESDKRTVKIELRLAAKGVLADPSDAALYINTDDFTVSDDGEVDSDALNEAIAELIERKPHLAAAKQNRFDGAADQGAKGKSDTVPQWTEADLARATDDETVAAKAAGKLNNLLGIKH